MKKIAYLVGLLILAGSPSTFAVGVQTGLVTTIIDRVQDGLIYIYFSGTATGQPACATTPAWAIKDETSDTGKRQLAMLMAAHAQGLPVTIIGSGACTRFDGLEDINYVEY